MDTKDRWRLFLLAAALAGSTGCAGPTMGASFSRFGLERASFELDCPSEKLLVKGLSETLESPGYAGSQVGVIGCGKRAVYVLDQQGGWLNNTGIETTADPT